MEDYCEPEFASKPPKTGQGHKLEVIKTGTIISTQYLTDSPIFIGRAPVCAVELQHPSISRFHAVLQFSKDNKWYLKDLESTHGSRLNKSLLKPGEFVEVPEGSIMQFGASTRLITLSYPYPHHNVIRQEPVNKRDEVEIKITIEKAKCELEKWLRKNGYDDQLVIAFSSSKRGDKGKEMVAHLSIQVFTGDEAENLVLKGVGKTKEEATDMACFEAIKELTVLGIFNRKRQKQKLESDSDEEILDITKTNKTRKVEKDFDGEKKPMTYESLLHERKTLQAQLKALENDLNEEKDKQVGQEDNEDDEFERYMSQIESNLKTSNVSLLQEQINSTKEELTRVETLLEIAKPS